MLRIALTALLSSVSILAAGQADSLQLTLRKLTDPSESADSYNIEVRLMSQKQLPIKFFGPLWRLFCCPDPDYYENRLELEILKDGCYKEKKVCGYCHDVGQPNLEEYASNTRELRAGQYYQDTADLGRAFEASYELIGNRKRFTHFIGQYRFRIWRYYWDVLGVHKISSDWFFVAFPDR